MNGIVIIDKDTNMTSRDVVDKVCKVFNTKKVGHTGTLDPLATGVLVVCVNSATKLVDRLTSSVKEYIAECLLGVETDTLDIDGTKLKEEDINIEEKTIKDILNSFKGTYSQEVPKYSAVKINGKKLYEYARENIDINLPKRDVTIYDIKLIDNVINKDNRVIFKFYCKVSKGTYIRSLIRDIACRLNTVGIMTNLRRISVDKFKIEDSIKLKDLTCDNLIPISDILDIKKVEITDDLSKKVLNGAKIDNIYDENEILFMKDNKEIALYKIDDKDNKLMKIEKMF